MYKFISVCLLALGVSSETIAVNNVIEGNNNRIFGQKNIVVGDQNIQITHNVQNYGSNNKLVGANGVFYGDNIHMFGTQADTKFGDNLSLSLQNDSSDSIQNQRGQFEDSFGDSFSFEDNKPPGNEEKEYNSRVSFRSIDIKF